MDPFEHFTNRFNMTETPKQQIFTLAEIAKKLSSTSRRKIHTDYLRRLFDRAGITIHGAGVSGASPIVYRSDLLDRMEQILAILDNTP